MKKRDVLSGKKLLALSNTKYYYGRVQLYRILAQAQRDADWEHEQNTVREIFEEIEKERQRECDWCGSCYEATQENLQCLKDKFLDNPKK